MPDEEKRFTAEELYYAVLQTQLKAQKSNSFAFKAGCICVAGIVAFAVGLYLLISSFMLPKGDLAPFLAGAITVWLVPSGWFYKKCSSKVNRQGTETEEKAPITETHWSFDQERKAFVMQCVDQERFKKVIARLE